MKQCETHIVSLYEIYSPESWMEHTVDVIIAVVAQAVSSRMEHRALYGLRE